MHKKPYGRALSTIFGASGKATERDYDEDDDPVIGQLHYLDYRYIRFFFHPPKDKFVLSNSWKDPEWTDVRTVRAGLDSEQSDHRALVFGLNLIDIEQKSIGQLLVDEVY